jgi:hypothetical protein
MKNWLPGIGAGVLLSGLILSAGCASEGYYAGGAYYDYDYYPDWGIYYYPRGHVYYWNDEGRWHSGERLPEHYDLHEHHSERLHLRSQQPWTEHHMEHPNGPPHHERNHDRD